jgi:hypothetical protein
MVYMFRFMLAVINVYSSFQSRLTYLLVCSTGVNSHWFELARGTNKPTQCKLTLVCVPYHHNTVTFGGDPVSAIRTYHSPMQENFAFPLDYTKILRDTRQHLSPFDQESKSSM